MAQETVEAERSLEEKSGKGHRKMNLPFPMVYALFHPKQRAEENLPLSSLGVRENGELRISLDRSEFNVILRVCTQRKQEQRQPQTRI